VSRTSVALESGGIPFWLPLVVVAGLVAGVIVVVASIALRPPDLPFAATSAPSATFTPTLPPSPSVATASGDASPVVPVEAIPLALTGATASSVVGDRAEFTADKAIDGNLETCWQEGAADEAGEWIEVTLDASRVEYLVIYSGYQLSHEAWLGNRRPRDVLVSVNDGPPIAFALADSEQPQRLDLDDQAAVATIRVTIASTYDAVATTYPGSPFDDLAITDIRVYGG
jgi:hypothetical protein